ncbi:MAG: folate-binding protein YgfZ [Gammaproteobacteria bacterium]|nr:folate-binding protein [Gammaproteobacteria bacterium]MDE1887190.1 folate-binding protein YgfZ [Gammaproteobacteria bacterium]MDE2023247.1 folate-binding protein YgfZ [Gammaproteobacteria bacterium]MDE2272655.1 folate-binding protein YgfZ [Gammaproteobacteria bacterium]
MHPDWRGFLQRQAAVLDAQRVLHFGNAEAGLRAAAGETVIADLSGDYGAIAVEGADCRSFLQGQLSTNLLALTPALSQFSSWSNPKGRVTATLRVLECDARLLLVLPRALTATVLKGLSMYVLRARAGLTDVGDTLCQFGLAGGRAPELLAACGLAVPAETNAVMERQGVRLIRLHGSTPRYSVLGPGAALQSLWTQLVDQGGQPAGSDAWTLLRILAGEPEVHPETAGHFVAQMLGLEELGAVHFNKGCYLGQEVIARAHYRGAVKRHMHRAACSSPETLSPGLAVLAAANDQPVGEIADACRGADGAWQMLLVLQDEFAAAPLQLHDAPVTVIS